MKAKGQQHQQQPYSSEIDAKEKLIVYVYEYLIHSNAKEAADIFKSSIGYTKDIKVSCDTPGFLMDWWCVFWDLYCAAPERRHGLPESSPDARAFHDFIRTTPMSPSITQTSPPQQQHPHPHAQQQHPQGPPPPPQFMAGGGGPRYGQPGQQPPRGPPRMQGPPPGQHGGPPPHPAGPPPGFMPAGSPRYAQQHSGPPPPQQQQPQHMNQGPMFVGGPGPDQMGHSPGLNRMTPVGGPPPPPPQQQQVVGPPPPNAGPPPQMVVGMPGHQQQQMVGGPPPGGPGGQGLPPPNSMQQQQQQQQGPPRNGSQGSLTGGGGGNWQGGGGGNVNYNVNSPANQPMYTSGGPGSNQPQQQQQQPMMMSDGSMMEAIKSSPGGSVNVNGGEPSTPHSQDEYVLPVPFGQETSDHSDTAEILKLKQSMQEDTTKEFEKEHPDFGLGGDYSDGGQNKWS